MKKLVIVLFIAAVGAGGSALYLWRELGAQRLRVAELETQLQESESRQASIAALANRRIRDPGDTAPANPDPDPGTPAPEQPQPGAEQAAAASAAIRELVASPEVQNLARNIQRTLLEQRYPDLAKVLNLSPEEADELFELLAKQQTDLRDGVRDMAGRGNGGNNIPDLRRMADEQRQAAENELAAMLGSKYPEWQQYEKTQTTRRQVSQLQNVLASGGTRLTDAQSGPLIAALSAEQQRIDQENRNAQMAASSTQEFRQQQAQRTRANNSRLVTAAAPYLTPQQLDTYQKMLERQQDTAGQVIRALGGQRRPGAGNGN